MVDRAARVSDSRKRDLEPCGPDKTLRVPTNRSVSPLQNAGDPDIHLGRVGITTEFCYFVRVFTFLSCVWDVSSLMRVATP